MSRVIPSDLLTRLYRAHWVVVRVSQKLETAQFTQRKKLEQMRERADDRFDAAVAAIIKAGDQYARKK